MVPGLKHSAEGNNQEVGSIDRTVQFKVIVTTIDSLYIQEDKALRADRAANHEH